MQSFTSSTTNHEQSEHRIPIWLCLKIGYPRILVLDKNDSLEKAIQIR